MKRLMLIAPGLVAVLSSLALTAVASAANGNPKYIECGKQAGGMFTDSACTKEGAGEFERKFIGIGESREVKAEGAGSYTLKIFIGSPISCKSVKFKAGANIKGAEKENAGTSEETIEYSECSVEGSPNCKINGGKSGEGSFSLNAKAKVAFEEKAGAENSEKELVKTVTVFEPANKKSFGTISLEGEKCPIENETEIKGSIIAKNPDGSEHKTTHIIEMVGEKPPTAYWENVEGKAKEVKPAKLEIFGGKATLTGKMILSLSSGIPWWVLVILGI